VGPGAIAIVAGTLATLIASSSASAAVAGTLPGAPTTAVAWVAAELEPLRECPEQLLDGPGTVIIGRVLATTIASAAICSIVYRGSPSSNSSTSFGSPGFLPFSDPTGRSTRDQHRRALPQLQEPPRRTGDPHPKHDPARQRQRDLPQARRTHTTPSSSASTRPRGPHHHVVTTDPPDNPPRPSKDRAIPVST